MTLVAELEARAAEAPDRIALVADGRRTTRAGLADAIDRASRVVQTDWSVGAGDRVAYLGANRADELVLLFALARLGAMLVPLNTRLATVELAGVVADAAPRVLVVDDEHAAVGRDLIAACRTTTTDEPIALRPLDALASSTEAVEPPDAARASSPSIDADAPVLIAYTSGTTGRPKGAVHTQAGLVANARASIAAHAMTGEDRVLTVLPLFHVGGLCIQTVPALVAGATVHLHPRFDAGAWLAAVERERITLSLMVPATLRAVLAHSAWSTTDLSSLRLLMTGSSIVPRALIDAVHARGVPVGQIYGATETGPVTVALTAADAFAKAGRAGWPCVDGSVRLVDGDGLDVVAGTVGELVVRAPNVMRGYWRQPAETGFRDGWFATGDLARRDADGCLDVVGRSRDLIISGGENVYPGELEAVLTEVDGVAEVAVIGVPDPRWNEVAAAFVVRRSGSALTEADVLAAFVDRLARFKHPKHVVFVDALPRNAMGKVEAHRLRERVTPPD